jgi:hypothetical protein
MNNKSYNEMIKLKTFRERLEYLKLNGVVGVSTFGYDRYLNQILYNSKEWKAIRNKVILRDNGCDLAFPDKYIIGKILIHHLNPISKEDIINRSYKIFDLDNLVCVSKLTHDAIHYNLDDKLLLDPIVRTKNDTSPWKLLK